MSTTENGWSAYEKLVMSELSDLKGEMVELHKEVTLLRIDLATLKVKAGVWGGVAGLVPALVTGLAIFSGVGNG